MNQILAQRAEAATAHFGVRREAKRHAALAVLAALRKAVSPLRSATALQNCRGRRRFQARLVGWKPALRRLALNRYSVGTGALYCLLILWLAGVAQAGDSQRFNLISIVTDDQARWSIGAYGNRESKTPQMDRLAREGARFLNAFACTPVCSPSRAAFLTGRYGTQLGITDWIAPEESGAGLGLPPETVTWPEVLQENGYVTGLIGKWHLGDQPQFHPREHGFHHFYGFLGGGASPTDPTLEVDGHTRKLKGPIPDLLVDNALQFVETNRSRPFALLLHFREPHLPYGPVPEADSAPFKDLDPTVPQTPGADIAQVKQWTRDYYASIHAVDRNLGRLLEKLEALNLNQKTIILFTSDHGYNIGHHGIHCKGNGWWIAGGVHGPTRPNMFEESIRVPLIIRWPGVTKPGLEIADPVSNIDTFASVLAMLGIAAPVGWKQEGIDFSPLLRGEKLPPREAIFAQYDLHHGGLAFMRMIRTDRWKLVRFHLADGLDELYDLDGDQGETRNGYRQVQHRQIRDELQQRLTGWQRSIDDPVLKLHYGKGIKQP